MLELLNINPKKPWLKSDGSKLTEKELNATSRYWTPLNWQEYLQTLEFEEDQHVITLKAYKVLESAPCGELKDLLPDSTNLTDEVLDLVRFALESHILNEREREVLHLIYWQGQSESEISEHLKTSIANFKKIKIKARSKIKRILEAYTAKILREKCANRGIEIPYKDKGDV
jgi:RNA polymerase sigma factor (sigma-70 family)